jgi:hypothetical protein
VEPLLELTHLAEKKKEEEEEASFRKVIKKTSCKKERKEFDFTAVYET